MIARIVWWHGTRVPDLMVTRRMDLAECSWTAVYKKLPRVSGGSNRPPRSQMSKYTEYVLCPEPSNWSSPRCISTNHCEANLLNGGGAGGLRKLSTYVSGSPACQ